MIQDKDSLQQLVACKEGSGKMLRNAGAAIIVLADQEKSDVWIDDCAVTMTNMHLMADSIGLGSCYINARMRKAADGGDTETFVKNFLSLPDKYRVVAILSLGVPVTLLARDCLVLLVSRDHLLAGKETIKLETLKDESFILMHPHVSVHDLAVSACEAAGFSPQVIRTARIESIIDAVRIGEGVSLLCEKQVSAFKLEEVALLKLHCPIEANVVLASRIKPPEHIRSFIKYLQTQSGIDS